MITLELIGIGTGNPDHLTGQAIAALNKADLVMIPSKAPKRPIWRICVTHCVVSF